MQNLNREKISQIPGILDELNLDLWLIIDQESGIVTDPMMQFLLELGVTWLSFFFFFRDGSQFAVVGNMDIEKTKQLELFDEIYAYKDSCKEDVLKLLQEQNPSTIALNYSIDSPSADGLTHGRFLQFASLIQGTDFSMRLVSAEEIISKLKGKKTGEELNRIKHAVKVTQDLFEKVTGFAMPGLSERDIAAFLKKERGALGLKASWEEESNPSVFTGPQETGAHSGPTDKQLERGHVFNIDFGVIYKDYCSDLQRTWYVLEEGEKEVPEDVQKGFDTIKKSIELAFDAIKPGVTGGEIDTIARQYIISQGYEEFPHALGHQVGRSAHDGGALLCPAWERYGRLPTLKLEEGQVFTIEPRLYLKDRGVVTIEEMIHITAEGAQWISEPQQELYLVK